MKNRLLASGLLGLSLASTAGVSHADIVHADDVIIQGSSCVGIDCVVNENFSADTIRLKENNLRIHFDDTSAAAGFAANDWRITANSQASGGASFFSIDDVTGNRVPFLIEANAPTNSLYVDSSGNIGLSTSAPLLELHLADSDTPSIRLEQDNSGGFTAQTWDVAGNEANFFIRDVTSGSRLPFRIRPGAPTSSLDILNDGDVGLGTGSPDAQLDIEDSGPTLRLTNTGAGGGIWDIKNNTTTGRLTYSDDPTGVRVPFKFGRNAVDNLLRIGVANTTTVDIAGNLVVNGNITATGTITPDYVFQPGYALMSIDEHADFMWQNSHLPKIGRAVETAEGKGLINLGERSQGLLEELEVAHIYIAELHARLGALEAEQQLLRQSVELLMQKQLGTEGKLYTATD